MSVLLHPRSAPASSTPPDRESPVVRALARTGLSAANLRWSSLVVRGATHWLASEQCPLDRRLLVTSDIDQYKHWIGVADGDVWRGACAATPQHPRWAVPPRRLARVEELSAAERREVRRAVAAYVWGDSAAMQAWRDVIARHAAPFELDVVVASRIELRDAAVLRIDARPTLLAVEQLILDDGQVAMHTDGVLSADVIEKRCDFGGSHAR
jgi:hypothetical protein